MNNQIIKYLNIQMQIYLLNLMGIHSETLKVMFISSFNLLVISVPFSISHLLLVFLLQLFIKFLKNLYAKNQKYWSVYCQELFSIKFDNFLLASEFFVEFLRFNSKYCTFNFIQKCQKRTPFHQTFFYLDKELLYYLQFLNFNDQYKSAYAAEQILSEFYYQFCFTIMTYFFDFLIINYQNEFSYYYYIEEVLSCLYCFRSLFDLSVLELNGWLFFLSFTEEFYQNVKSKCFFIIKSKTSFSCLAEHANGYNVPQKHFSQNVSFSTSLNISLSNTQVFPSLVKQSLSYDNYEERSQLYQVMKTLAAYILLIIFTIKQCIYYLIQISVKYFLNFINKKPFLYFIYKLYQFIKQAKVFLSCFNLFKMFSYKTYEMTQNAIIDEIQKYATQIFTIETQNNLEENEHMSFSLSQSHSQESIPNDEEQHQYPDESQVSQMNIGRHIFNDGMTKSNILSNYNRSQANKIQPINFKLMKHKHHNKNIHTQRSSISKRKKNRYAQNYVSPYNKREVNSTARSYMSKSFINPSKESNNMKYIKKKINEQIQPQISYRKHEENINKQKNQKLINVASKYKETKPLMQGYVDYMNQHIYKKERNEMNYLMELQKKGSNRTKEDLQNSWDIFLQKERDFKQSKKQRIREKQVQIMEQQQQYIKTHRQKADEVKQKKERVGLTVEQNIRKIKRQKQKMKERLHTGQISNFMTKSFQNKKFQTNNKDIFKSVLGINIEQNYSTIQEDSSQNINEMSQLQNKIRNTILKQQALLNQSQMKKSDLLKNVNSTAINKIMNKKANELSAEKKNRTSKQEKSRSKNKNISQLLNPKYFKSINQLQEYSTSKSKQKKSFQQREKFINYRNKLQKRNQRLYGFDPKIMQASIEHFRRHQQMFQQNEEIANQRKYDFTSYRNISNLYPSAHKNQNNVRNLSTQSKIRHFQQRFKSYKNSIQSSKVNEKSSNNPPIFKKPGSFSYKPVNSPSNNSSLVKIKATDMNFLFDSSNLL